MNELHVLSGFGVELSRKGPSHATRGITQVFKIPFLLLLLSFCLANHTMATNYYVRTDGSNGNSGTSNSALGAWRTIHDAVSKALPGDVINVADGTYYEEQLYFQGKNGSQTNRLVLRAINKHKAKIISTSTAHGINIDGCTGITIDGIDLSFPAGTQSEGFGILVEGHWVTIKNCYIHDAPFSGIQGYLVDNFLVENNLLYRNCRGTGKTINENGSGISVYHPISRQNNSGFHIIIRNNICYENEARNNVRALGKPTDGNGIILDDFHATQEDDIEKTGGVNYPHSSLVENNVVFNNGGHGIQVFDSDNATVRNNTCWYNGYVLNAYGDVGNLSVSDGINNKLYNNISVSDPALANSYALRIISDGSSTQLRHNMFAGKLYFTVNTETKISSSVNYGNLTNASATYPQFVNATKQANFDFRLKAASPAIDKGYNANAAALDFDGKTRPVDGTVDMGSYEYGVTNNAVLANGLYTLTSKIGAGGSPVRVLDVSGATEANNQNVRLWESLGNDAQQWRIESTGDGYYKLVAQVGGKTRLLNAANGGRGNGANVSIWAPAATNGAANQRWKIEADGDGTYRLTTKASATESVKYCLDVTGGTNANGTNVQIYRANGYDNQRWRIEPVGSAASRAAADPAQILAMNLSAYPNPSSDGRAAVQLTAKEAQWATVTVRNEQGQLVSLFTVLVAAGQNDCQLSSTLPPGTYYVQATLDGPPQRFTLKVQ